jgi:hypothetical protein
MGAALLAALALMSATSADPAKPTYPDQCGARPPGWLGPKSRFGDLTMRNTVNLRRNGRLAWNGQDVSDQEIRHLLSQTYRLNPRPLVLMTVQRGTPCSRVKQVRLLMNATSICKTGHCGEGSDWPFPAPLK